LSGVQSAQLFLHLYDDNGVEVYKATGVTQGKWTKKCITAPGDIQAPDSKHTNAVILDTGDRMMILGNNNDKNQRWGSSAFRSYNIIINSGWDTSKLTT
jgi:hypothetical protein